MTTQVTVLKKGKEAFKNNVLSCLVYLETRDLLSLTVILHTRDGCFLRKTDVSYLV